MNDRVNDAIKTHCKNLSHYSRNIFNSYFNRVTTRRQSKDLNPRIKDDNIDYPPLLNTNFEDDQIIKSFNAVKKIIDQEWQNVKSEEIEQIYRRLPEYLKQSKSHIIKLDKEKNRDNGESISLWNYGLDWQLMHLKGEIQAIENFLFEQLRLKKSIIILSKNGLSNYHGRTIGMMFYLWEKTSFPKELSNFDSQGEKIEFIRSKYSISQSNRTFIAGKSAFKKGEATTDQINDLLSFFQNDENIIKEIKKIYPS